MKKTLVVFFSILTITDVHARSNLKLMNEIADYSLVDIGLMQSCGRYDSKYAALSLELYKSVIYAVDALGFDVEEFTPGYLRKIDAIRSIEGDGLDTRDSHPEQGEMKDSESRHKLRSGREYCEANVRSTKYWIEWNRKKAGIKK